jgi:hypothetical protein
VRNPEARRENEAATVPTAEDVAVGLKRSFAVRAEFWG